MIDVSHLVGIPWIKRGRDMTGMDCLGIVIAARQMVGKKTPDYNYDEIDPEKIDRDFRAFGFVRLGRAHPFCLVTFMSVPPFSSHLGVVLDDCQTFLHNRSGGPGRACIERLDSPVWRRKTTGYFEIAD